jgi:hypothetical protein
VGREGTGEALKGSVMIAIGNDLGGPEQRGSLIHSMLNKAMNIAADVRDANYNDGTEAWINPIFIVPGSVSKPEFEGYKLGHFSRKHKGLVVMIAVPQSVADREDVADFVGISLRESVRLAAAYFADKNISFSMLKAEKIILAIEAALRT